MDEAVMLWYLSWVHIALGHYPFALVLDSFRGHDTERIRRRAESLGVQLIPVPRGMTGEYQPLDRSCFGPLKKMSQRAWDVRAASEPTLQWNHAEGTRLLEEVWPHLNRATILKGWDFTSETGDIGHWTEEAEGEETEGDDADQDFESGHSALSESAPSETTDWSVVREDCARRMNAARARGGSGRWME
jgi:hypothetical protein